ncbi:MAG: ketoacyl-ACP synthase III [Dictyoglomi bacterium]|nr:ketoacyl-ACP synthase III [Dictyoglomota bacterium]
MSVRKVGVRGIGAYTPPKVVTNFDLEKIVETSDEWIFTRTGIRERRIAEPDMATSDLSYMASKIALDSANLTPGDLDLIIVATVTPDMFFPATACILQDKLGATCPGFDLSAGCSGLIYALSVGAQFIANGMYDNILVVGGETLSKIIDWQDRSTCVLFGDAASAVILGPVDTGGFRSFVLGADGGGGKLLELPAGGSRLPASYETISQRLHFIKMNGRDVFKFAVRVMEEASLEAIDKAGLTLKDIDLFIPHQANIRIIESAAERLNVPKDKFFVNLDRYGNTSSASVGLALYEAFWEGKIQKGSKILMVGFGAGLTWGACVLEW